MPRPTGKVAGAGPIPPDVPIVKIVRKGTLQAVHSRFPSPHQAPYETPSFGSGPVVVLTVHLRPMARADVWRNDAPFPAQEFRRGGLAVFDLRDDWRAVLYPTFDTVNVYVSLDALAQAAGKADGSVTLDVPPMDPDRIDPTMLNLAEALLPAFRRPGELMALFADQVMAAVSYHVASTYTEFAAAVPKARGGLASWQQRRAEDMLIAAIDSDVRLADLAEACRLSSSHFAQAFRQTNGVSPHRWLTEQRVGRAQDLLKNSSESLSQIALSCGFADQSHLTRVFRKAVGVSPGAWRRMRRS